VTLPKPTAEDQKAELVFTGTAGTNHGTDAASCPNALAFAPTSVDLSKDSSVLLNANVSACGYQVHTVGAASADDFAAITKDLPPLDDGVATALVNMGNAKVDLTCARSWTGAQACTASQPAVLKRLTGKRRR
jgi:hypothetical protein